MVPPIRIWCAGLGLRPMELAPRLPDRPTTRFAPSPTGFLHLGHVANAVWTWGVAQARGGRVVLRMEDHDRGRCRPEYERSILRDLNWLGLEVEPESRRSFEAGPSAWRQSDTPERYRDAVARLAGAATVFGCECSRRSMAAAAGAGPEPGEELRYPGTCRDKGLELVDGRGIRVVLADRAVGFEDLRLGTVSQHPARQCGDLLLRDQTGNWTYQLCVVVDDLVHGIDLVVRGEDLLASTGRQILLGEMLGWGGRPRYLHHPLIIGDAGVKLSKRAGSATLASLREAGVTPAEVLGMAAYHTGLLAAAEPIAGHRLGELFR